MNSNQAEIVWLQLSAGQGPKECAWVVAQILKRLLQESERYAVTAELIENLAFDKALRNQNLIEIDAYLSCLVRLEGIDATPYAKSWIGTIKWQGESLYRPKHKRCNWFAGVEQVSIVNVKNINVKQLIKECDVEAMRSSGPGGQHVNKTNSAVRIIHRPSGIQIRVDTDRSQHRNRHLAMERLQIILAIGEETANKAQVRGRWMKHHDVKRGNPVRIFQGREFKQIS